MIKPVSGMQEYRKPDVVKVVIAEWYALYFSRWPIPFSEKKRMRKICDTAYTNIWACMLIAHPL